MNLCVNVSLVADGDDAEDIEIIEIQLESSSSPLAGIIPGFSIRRISIACSENTLRLTGGADSAQGRVEICNQQVWGSVCTLLWDQPDAQVVCRQLGFVGRELLGKKNCYIKLKLKIGACMTLDSVNWYRTFCIRERVWRHFPWRQSSSHWFTMCWY